MNPVHAHLLLNHLPIIFPIVGMLVLIGGIILNNEIVKRTSYLIFIASAILTFPAFISGEAAEDIVENINGITIDSINKHIEWADKLMFFNIVLGAVSILGFWSNLKNKSYSNTVAYVILVICATSMFFAQQTGRSGGEIRHTEIRSNFNQDSSPQSNPEKNKNDKDND
ncbi:MAG: hypothetical protein NT007_17450 [Candidatus Kapabacteria bacterium]|nr:hypothetical protein [Candidatus Kapabacteria bacterium]